MPIYEYECTQCGAVEEAIQNFSDKSLSVCKNCSGHLQKLISQSSFHLKGTGWYVTDYAGKNNNNAVSAPKKSEDNSASPSAETPAASSKTSDSSDS